MDTGRLTLRYRGELVGDLSMDFLHEGRPTGVREAIVDFEFPLGVAERLRADGIRLTVNEELFSLRRRVKTPQEMAGIRRAQRAAEAGMAAAAALLRRAESLEAPLP